MAKPSIANPSLRFRFQIHPASKLKHAITALSEPDFNKRGKGLIEVGNRGLEITARNTKTGVVGYLRFKTTGLINFCCAIPIKNNKINLNRISQNLVEADDDDTITIHNLDGSTDLCFVFGNSPTQDFSVELIEINGELEKFPQLTCACEAVMLSKHLREMIQPEIVSLDITDNNLNIFAGKRLYRYYYDMKKGGGARGMEPGEEHNAMFRWPHNEALKKASFLSIRLVIYLVINPLKTIILRFHLPELGDLVFICNSNEAPLDPLLR